MLSEIVSGLNAANLAAQLIKDLKQIDRSIDEATFKLKLAELTEALADTKIALSEVREILATRDAEIRALREQLESAVSGDTCPVCRAGKMQTLRVKKHPTFGDLGVQEKTLRCDNAACGHDEERMHDPNGLIGK